MNPTDTFDVYVANLIPSDTEDDLRAIFDVVGEIHSVKILQPKDGESRNVAFVRFLDEKDAECAAKYFNNHILEDNRSLIVRYRSKENKDTQRLSNDYPNKTDNTLTSPTLDKLTVQENVKEAAVVHIESPICFYGHNMDPKEAIKLQEITEELEKSCPTCPRVIGQMSSQQIYGCKFSEDGMWYRCCVGKCLPKNEVEVQYIDYGNNEIVDRFGLVSLPASLTSHPAFASCYQIENMELVDHDSSSQLFQKGAEKLKQLVADKCLEITVKGSDSKVTYVKEIKVDNDVLDVKQALLDTGSAKIKEILNGFTSPPPSAKTPFSTFRKTSTRSESNGWRSNGDDQNKTNGFFKESSDISSLKKKLSDKDDMINEIKRSTTEEIVSLKNTIKTQTDKYNNLNVEIEKMKAQTEKPQVTASFASLLDKVRDLRNLRAASPVGEDVFNERLQAIVDLYMKSDASICLASMIQYNDVQTEQENLKAQREFIMKCSDKEQLTELLEERDNMIRKCVKSIRAMLKHVATLPLSARWDELQDGAEYLRNNFSHLIDACNDVVEPLEICMEKYRDERSNADAELKKLREASNEKSSKLFKLLGQFQRECHCIVSVKASPEIADVDTCILDYKGAVDEETASTKILLEEMKKSDKLKSVICSLQRSINTELEDIKFLKSQDFKEKYEDAMEKLKASVKSKPDTGVLLKARKQIKQLKSKFRHKQADLIDLEEDSDETDKSEIKEIEKGLDDVRSFLHEQFVKEHEEMIKLAEASKGNFPELVKLHPELSLEDFIESNNLWQRSRTIDHYIQLPSNILRSQPKKIAYKYVFNGQPCVIKEVSLSTRSSDLLLKNVVDRIVEYTKQDRVNCMKISCIFTDKSERKLYYHQGFASEGNLIQFIRNTSPELNVLKTLFKDLLRSLASNHNPHYGIKPENILVNKTDDGKISAYLGEPSFIIQKKKSLISCLNKCESVSNYPKLDLFINQPPSQSDLICLAGVMLWAFYQDATFSEMVHNDIITIVNDDSLKTLLQSMLSVDQNERLTACEILSHPFFNQNVDVTDDVTSVMDNTSNISKIVNVDESMNLTSNMSTLNLDDTLLIRKEDEPSDVIINITKTNDVSDDGEMLEKSIGNDGGSVEGKEIDAWEKALQEKKNKRLGEIQEEERPNVLEESLITISDDDDF